MTGPNVGEREARGKDQLCIHVVHLRKSRKWMNTPTPFPEKVQGWNIKVLFTYGNRKKEDPELKKTELLGRIGGHHASLDSAMPSDNDLLLQAGVKLKN